MLNNVGRLRESLSFQLIAQATDKWGAPKAVKVALIYANMGNLPAARAWIQNAFERWPNHSAVRMDRLYIAGFYEQPADALATIEAVHTQTPTDDDRTAIWRTFVKARAAHSTQLTGATIPKIREAADQGEIAREIAIMMLAALGQTKQAIEATNLALDHQQLEPKFLFTPVMHNVRRDAGFVGLASRMGLLRYWRETGQRPDFCTDRAASGECSPQLLAALKSS